MLPGFRPYPKSEGADVLTAAGVEPFFGDVDDHACLRSGALLSDGVIHAAFNHDFSTFISNCEKDRLAIQTMGEALVGTQRPLIVTSAVALGSPSPDSMAVENHFNPQHPNPRKASELGAITALQQGVNVSVIRLSQVHNPLKQGLVTALIETARQKVFLPVLERARTAGRRCTSVMLLIFIDWHLKKPRG